MELGDPHTRGWELVVKETQGFFPLVDGCRVPTEKSFLQKSKVSCEDGVDVDCIVVGDNIATEGKPSLHIVFKI